MRTLTYSVSLLLLISGYGCGDDDGAGPIDGGETDGGHDGGPPEGGPPGDAPLDGGWDAGSDAGPTPLSADVCEPSEDGQRTVDVAGDGSLVAYVTCGDAGAKVWTLDLEDDEASPIEIADAESTWTVELSPRDEHVLYGTGTDFWVRRVDATAEEVALSDGVVEAYRFLLEKVSTTEFASRLLVAEEDATGDRRIHVRASDDDYATTTVLVEDDGVEADLSLVSLSGRTLVAVVDDAGTRTYVNVRTDGTEALAEFSFGPESKGVAPVGLGDTHALMLTGDRLERIKWNSGEVFIELAASGVLEDQSELYMAEMGRGNKFVHFIQNGDPSRRDREAMDPIEVLADVDDATSQALSPDESMIVFHSGTEVLGVPADGSEDAVVLAEIGSPTEMALVFSPDSSEIAVIDEDGGLKTAPVFMTDMAVLEAASGVEPGSVVYGGDGAQLFWMVGDAVWAREDAEPFEVTSGVTAFWPIPETTDVLVLEADGELRRVTP